jgi:hypothetical protein
LGAQYAVSRVYTNFYVGSNWAHGGRIDVAAVPGAYSNVYDSGVGNQFAFTDSTGYTFPSQPVRYIRLTDYAIPAGGPSAGILESIQAFGTPPARVAYFPLGDDGNYFKVNLARRRTGDPQPTASVAYSNGATSYVYGAQDPGNAIDGDDRSFRYSAASGSETSATATLTVDLGQTQTLGAIRQYYWPTYNPVSTSIRVAQSSSGPWTQVLADTAVTAYDFTSSFAAIPARYIELTMKGTTSNSAGILIEMQAFPSSTSEPAPGSASQLDMTYLTGMSIATNAGMGVGGSPQVHSVQGASGFFIKNASQGATGDDATFTIDLGQQYSISEVGLSFYGNQTWPAGGKIDVEDSAGNWVNVFDSGHGIALGLATDSMQRISFVPRLTRHIRVTGYYDPAAIQGLLSDIEVF